MAIAPEDRALLGYLTGQRDLTALQAGARKARTRTNLRGTPFAPVEQRASRTWSDPTGDRATGNADKASR